MDEDFDNKIKNYIIKFLHANKFVEEDDGIFQMEKAFIVASSLKHILYSRKNKTMTEKDMNIFFQALSDFKLNKVDLFWQDSVLKFKPLLKKEGIINEKK